MTFKAESVSASLKDRNTVSLRFFAFRQEINQPADQMVVELNYSRAKTLAREIQSYLGKS
jgi:hypothetical protein